MRILRIRNLRWEMIISSLLKKNSYHYMGLFGAGVGVFTTLIQVNVIVAGAILIAYNRLNISDLITFLLYIGVFLIQ